MVIVYTSQEELVKSKEQKGVEVTFKRLREELRVELEQIKKVDWGKGKVSKEASKK